MNSNDLDRHITGNYGEDFFRVVCCSTLPHRRTLPGKMRVLLDYTKFGIQLTE